LKKLLAILSKTGFDGFLLMIGTMILLAYFLPQPGMVKEPVSLELIAGAGVSLIFLFYGLRLSVEKLKAGLANWKMHIIVQLTTFLFFPLIVLAFRPLFIGTDLELVWLAIFSWQLYRPPYLLRWLWFLSPRAISPQPFLTQAFPV
jgi:solute carrier family 10 (sodium/bile acid cotransporter), member 7